MSAPSNLAITPAPPYYAVIFTSLRTEVKSGYDAMAQRMLELGSRYVFKLSRPNRESGARVWKSVRVIRRRSNRLLSWV
jgi:hypothetical protein